MQVTESTEGRRWDLCWVLGAALSPQERLPQAPLSILSPGALLREAGLRGPGTTPDFLSHLAESRERARQGLLCSGTRVQQKGKVDGFVSFAQGECDPSGDNPVPAAAFLAHLCSFRVITRLKQKISQCCS